MSSIHNTDFQNSFYDLLHDLNRLKFLEKIHHFNSYWTLYKLIGTEYVLCIEYLKPFATKWQYEKYASILDYHFHKFLSFEEVLESVSGELQEKLLFNLDIFRK